MGTFFSLNSSIKPVINIYKNTYQILRINKAATFLIIKTSTNLIIAVCVLNQQMATLLTNEIKNLKMLLLSITANPTITVHKTLNKSDSIKLSHYFKQTNHIKTNP